MPKRNFLKLVDTKVLIRAKLELDVNQSIRIRLMVNGLTFSTLFWRSCTIASP